MNLDKEIIEENEIYPGMSCWDEVTRQRLTMVRMAAPMDQEMLMLGKACRGNWNYWSVKWIARGKDGKEMLVALPFSMTQAAYQWQEPEVSLDDLKKALRKADCERMLERLQSGVNYNCAQASENALKEIALLLGWKWPSLDGSCVGCPPEDIEQTALRLVKELVERRRA